MATTSTANTKQHYVPQMLLRGFSVDGNGEQVRVFEKPTGREFRTAIENIGAERGYYDLEGSAELDESMNAMDNVAAPIIRKIRDRRSLSAVDASESVVLATFTVLQMIRTRGYQEHWHHLRQAAVEALRAKVGEAALPRWILDFDRAEDRRDYLAAIPGFARDFVPHLLDKNLLLFRADPTFPFIIGDNPVAMHNGMNKGDGIRGTLGLAIHGIEIYLPISSELTLAFLCPSIGESYEILARELKLIGGFINEDVFNFLRARDTGKALKLRREGVQFQNSLQTVFAERFLISSVGNFADAGEIVRERPELRAGPRMRVF
jgi:Protein of unknown function (DUF4238)